MIGFVLILFLSIACAFPCSLWAQESGEALGTVPPASDVSKCTKLTGITFDGLKRTKEYYVQHELSHHLGQCLEALDLNEVETELQDIGLFDEIHAETRQTGESTASLDISLKEKWYYIPIPMIAYVDEFMGGLFFMDMNAFGVNDKFVIGGIASKSKIRLMASFSTPSLVGRPGLVFAISGATDDSAYVDMNNNTILEYQSTNYKLISKVIFKFTQTSSTSLGVTYLYEDNKPKNSYMDEIGALSEISVSSLALNGGYKYEALNWNGWFMSRTMASIDAELALMDGDTVSPSVLVNLSYQRPVIFDRLRVIAHAAGYYSYQSKIPVYRRARTVGADFLPNDFNSPMMVGGGAGLEVGVYRFEWASFSIGGQYQVVYAQDCDETMGFHHGWSASVNVNLSKVAFPAFSVGLTQDVTTGDLRFALGMGMSM